MTLRCSRCDVAHDETSRCPTELEYERGYRAGMNQKANEFERLTKQLAEARAECERLRGDGQFVVHTGDDLEYYDTEKEAIEAAQRAIYELSADSETGWPAIVNNVKVMRVVHAVKQFDHVDDDGVPFTLYTIAEE